MIDTKKLYDVRQELSREHGVLVTSVSRSQVTTKEVANLGDVELTRLVLIQDALRALELVLQNYSQRIDVVAAGNPAAGGEFPRSHPPAPEETDVVLVDESTLLKAEDLLTGCGACTKAAELTFEYLLDAFRGSDSPTTEYLLRRPAKCPRCFAPVTEKTLISYG